MTISHKAFEQSYPNCTYEIVDEKGSLPTYKVSHLLLDRHEWGGKDLHAIAEKVYMRTELDFIKYRLSLLENKIEDLLKSFNPE